MGNLPNFPCSVGETSHVDPGSYHDIIVAGWDRTLIHFLGRFTECMTCIGLATVQSCIFVLLNSIVSATRASHLGPRFRSLDHS